MGPICYDAVRSVLSTPRIVEYCHTAHPRCFSGTWCRPKGLGLSIPQRPALGVTVFAEEPSKRRKFITKEQEPEEYWISKAEREGKSPMQDPLAYIGLLAIFVPFIILGIAIATGYVDLNP